VTLRLAAALTLLFGALGLAVYLDVMGHGPLAGMAGNHLRAMKDRRTPPATVQPFTLADFDRLPHRVAVADYSVDERRGVAMEGYIQRIMRAIDDDYHLEITPTPRRAGGPDTIYASAEITPGVRGSAPRWQYERLLEALRPNHGGVTEWEDGPRRVRISGWLCYDYQYDEPPSAWERRLDAPRVSGWEIHPVTRIELWDPSLGRYVDYAP
jgi:hypothetical protein